MTAKAVKQPHSSVVIEPAQVRAATSEASVTPRSEPFVAECIIARHPTLEGRVRVRWITPNADSRSEAKPCERWLPILRGLVIRERDRVLVMPTANEPEPIVVGVVDGFTRRAEPPQTSAVQLELRGDETFRITGERGQPLVEIVQGSNGPVVRLLHADTELELPGKLKLRAAEIELTASRGDVRIEANDDARSKVRWSA